MLRLPELLRAFQGSEKNITAPPTFRLKGEWGTTRKTVAVQCCLFFADEKLAKCTAQFPPLFFAMHDEWRISARVLYFRDRFSSAWAGKRRCWSFVEAETAAKLARNADPHIAYWFFSGGVRQLGAEIIRGFGGVFGLLQVVCVMSSSEIRECFKLKFESLQDALKIMFFAARTHMERKKTSSFYRLPLKYFNWGFCRKLPLRIHRKGKSVGEVLSEGPLHLQTWLIFGCKCTIFNDILLCNFENPKKHSSNLRFLLKPLNPYRFCCRMVRLNHEFAEKISTE